MERLDLSCRREERKETGNARLHVLIFGLSPTYIRLTVTVPVSTVSLLGEARRTGRSKHSAPLPSNAGVLGWWSASAEIIICPMKKVATAPAQINITIMEL